MIGWVTQGLTKVLPQPDDKYKETNDEEEHTEVRNKSSLFSDTYETSINQNKQRFFYVIMLV